MKRIYLLLTCGLLCSHFTYAEQPNSDEMLQAEKIYKRSCATCHGRAAEKHAMGESKIINQLSSEEIYTALLDHKNGKIQGAGNNAKSRLSEEEMKAVASYIQGLGATLSH